MMKFVPVRAILIKLTRLKTLASSCENWFWILPVFQKYMENVQRQNLVRTISISLIAASAKTSQSHDKSNSIPPIEN